MQHLRRIRFYSPQVLQRISFQIGYELKKMLAFFDIASFAFISLILGFHREILLQPPFNPAGSN